MGGKPPKPPSGGGLTLILVVTLILGALGVGFVYARNLYVLLEAERKHDLYTDPEYQRRVNAYGVQRQIKVWARTYGVTVEPGSVEIKLMRDGNPPAPSPDEPKGETEAEALAKLMPSKASEVKKIPKEAVFLEVRMVARTEWLGLSLTRDIFVERQMALERGSFDLTTDKPYERKRAGPSKGSSKANAKIDSEAEARLAKGRASLKKSHTRVQMVSAITEVISAHRESERALAPLFGARTLEGILRAKARKGVQVGDGAELLALKGQVGGWVAQPEALITLLGPASVNLMKQYQGLLGELHALYGTAQSDPAAAAEALSAYMATRRVVFGELLGRLDRAGVILPEPVAPKTSLRQR